MKTSDIHIGVAVPNVSSNGFITPESGQTGVSTITLNVTDGHTTNSTSFNVTVSPAPLGVVYSEDWAYPDGPLYLNSGGSGGPWSHVSGPAGEIQVSNQLCELVYTNNEDMGTAFIGGHQYDGSLGYVFYTSFTASCPATPACLATTSSTSAPMRQTPQASVTRYLPIIRTRRRTGSV